MNQRIWKENTNFISIYINLQALTSSRTFLKRCTFYKRTDSKSKLLNQKKFYTSLSVQVPHSRGIFLVRTHKGSSKEELEWAANVLNSSLTIMSCSWTDMWICVDRLRDEFKRTPRYFIHLFNELIEKGETSLESPFGSVISVKSMPNLDGIV